MARYELNANLCLLLVFDKPLFIPERSPGSTRVIQSIFMAKTNLDLMRLYVFL